MPELTLRAKPSDQIKIHNAWGGRTSEEGNYSIDSGLNMMMVFPCAALCGRLRSMHCRRHGETAFPHCVFSFWKDSAAAPSSSTLCRNPPLFTRGPNKNQQGPVRNAQGQNKHAFAVTHMRTHKTSHAGSSSQIHGVASG